MKKGLFIVFEGGEFVGKTTQQKRAKIYLESKGLEVVATHEPGDGDPDIREKLLDAKGKISPEEELNLFCEDRRLHMQNVIGPALDEGKIVLSDRFEYSTISYQGYGRGLPLDHIKKKNTEARGDAKPDLVLLLSADPFMVFQREKTAKDRFEKENLAFHQRVWLGFLVQAAEDRKRWRVIDATLSEEEVWQEVKKYLDQLISSRPSPSNV